MSLKIGITGAQGLIGWHIRAWLHAHRPDIEVRLGTRDTFADPGTLARFADGLDAIVHCAGMNRGDDRAVEEGNLDIARRLAAACDAVAGAGGRYPHVVYANSTHRDRDTAYGRGKRAAAELLGQAAGRQGAPFANLILPHVFGEFGRPFYNSVVSTFCHQLAVGETPGVQVDGDLELVHAQDVAARCVAAVATTENGDCRLTGTPLKVSALLRRLTELSDAYAGRNVVPELGDPLDRALFNTLRSYRFPQSMPGQLVRHRDARGSLFEAMKAANGGQTFFSTTAPGVTRGNHFHTRKFERFIVCAGEAEIRLRRLFSDEIHRFPVTGETPHYIDMPTFHVHNITNTGTGELLTLFWANEIFDPAQPDTFTEAVGQ
jgi:UDP-2-acetamido-2,6-beta-L-arabino-hexul-4-ose reductase